MTAKNGYSMTITNEHAAYIAGLFDGEGSIYFTRRPEKKKKHKGKGFRYSNSMRISMEVTMTDESVVRWVHEILRRVGPLLRNHEKVFVKMVQNF
jgi:intein/homing endonuclease